MAQSQIFSDPLLDLMTRCCVKVIGASRGTGFFVAPGRVLTCAHVVGHDLQPGKVDVQVWWQDDSDDEVDLLDIAAHVDDDLALLSVRHRGHPCVYLHGGEDVDDGLYVWGFPLEGNTQIGDGIKGDFESYSDLGSGRFLLKFRESVVQNGFSGSPLLNTRTGSVIGVVSETRGGDYGGRAVPANLALDRFDAYLADAQASTSPHLARWFEAAKAAASREKTTPRHDDTGKKPPQHNLDEYRKRDRFVGRGEHIAALRQRLQEGAALITLIGPGGSGKTRLALEVVAGLMGNYPDGIWMIGLADIQESDLIIGEIAREISVELTKQRTSEEAIVEILRGRHLLLILDNCEHLLSSGDGATGELLGLVHAILGHCPQVTILATSRVSLGLAEEQRYELPPLKVPTEEEALQGDLSQRFEAIQLFEERAQRHDQHFKVDATNAEHVGEICRSLAGLPLAIEIATAQLRRITEVDLVRVLDHALDWKQPGPFIDHRHKTLESVINWSYQLLSDSLKRVFRNLSVFVGGFFESAAGALQDADLRDALFEIYDGSLLVREKVAGRYRFAMLEPVRQFAAALLTDEDKTDVSRRHANWYAGLAQKAGPQLLGPAQDAWLESVEIDYPNFMKALSWSVERDIHVALKLCANLWRFWDIRSLFQEGLQRLETVLARAGEDCLQADYGGCLSGAGLLAHRQGLSQLAHGYFERALYYERDHGNDKIRLVRALNDMGIAYNLSGDAEAAVDIYREAIAEASDLDDERELGTIYFNLGKQELETGQFDEAEKDLMEARRLFKACQDDRDLAFPLCWLGMLCALKRPAELDRANEYLSKSHQLRTKANDVRGIANCLNGLGLVSLYNNEEAQAKQHFLEALALQVEIENLRGIAETLEWFTLYMEQQDELETAIELSAAASSIRAEIEVPRSPVVAGLHANLLTRGRDSLGMKAFQRAERHGEETDRDDLVKRLLS